MYSLVKVFSNFREFYSEINGATLTGAIDVIVVEQPDGEFQCSPFHVRFGKLGVLRSREKVVDIEINGEPVDIHMKLGDSGEAFFVEECDEEDVEELPYNLATSPIPTSNFPDKFTKNEAIAIEANKTIEEKDKIASDDMQLSLPMPRRNSIDLSKEADKNENVLTIENQVSDFSHRRHTDNTMNRNHLYDTLKEYTTQKLRQEWAEHEEIFQFDNIEKDKDWMNSTQADENEAEMTKMSIKEPQLVEETKMDMEVTLTTENKQNENENIQAGSEIVLNSIKDETKSKKKRRKKTQMKKKNAQRKSSSSSSIGSNAPTEGVPNNNGSTTTTTTAPNQQSVDDVDVASVSTNSISVEEANANRANEQTAVAMINAQSDDKITGMHAEDTDCQITPITPTTRIPDLDIHFFSDTEVTSSGGNGPCGTSRSVQRPSTPIQSDSELEISMRDKDGDMLNSTASWKWGELPTPDNHGMEVKITAANGQTTQTQRNSMLSGMFNFMKKTNKMRQQANGEGIYLSDLIAEGMDPEIAAMYLPQEPMLKQQTPVADETSKLNTSIATSTGAGGDDDRESGNGTSLPQSPSSMEGQKSIDSDYDDSGKITDEKCLDIVAMSLCGMNEKNGPTDEEFDQHLIKYNDVFENPSLLSSPNLVVRLNGKYYTWAAACVIVMTIITYQKPMSNSLIEHLITNANKENSNSVAAGVSAGTGTITNTTEVDNTNNISGGQAKRSWWNWRRSQSVQQQTEQTNLKIKNNEDKIDGKDIDQSAVATQTTRPNSPDVSDNTLSKTESTLNAENTSALAENLDDLSQTSSKNDSNNKNERYKKSLRLSSEAIKKLNLRNGMNEVEFSVTTAYQGTTRCKCFLFRWKHNDKVVISDIDGTITKSDVLGHILPMVGKDWAQLGVAQLFSKIEKNGYKLLYLSARAIGQSRVTREYLRSIRQGNVQLPDGPLLLNPTSLISAFHREVIEKKPEEFKIACLSDIRDLFPNKDPFYAGYGNRINDVWAYRAVGIPIMRIFTINTKGELKHELTQTFQSSYCRMTLIVDQLFPPIECETCDTEYSNFYFWRDPIPEIDIDLDSFNNSNNSTVDLANTSKNSNLNSSLSKALSTIPEN